MIKKNNTTLVAEIGWNFLGNLTLAKKMIKSAKINGADYVKFQIWDPKYLKSGKWDKDGRKQIYEKSFLNKDKYLTLKKFSKKIGVNCFASAFTIQGAEILKKSGDKIIKIPSHEAYNENLIKYALKNFKLVLVSLGALKEEELKKLLKYKINKKFIPMHCVSSYPLLAKNCNFEKFDYLKSIFRYVGYSGHFSGIEDAIFAFSKGAKIVEKHFTINKSLPGRDNKFAILPKELKELKKWTELTNDFNKSHGLGLQRSERDIFKNYRGRWNGKK